MSIIIGIDHGY